MKRVMFIFLSSLFMLTAINSVYSQDTEGDTGSLHWAYDGGVLTITGEGDMPDYVYGEKPWNHLGSMIDFISIAEGVTSIGNYAFQSCSLDDSIAIPNSVTRIGNYAFYLDGNLKRVFIGSGVTTIGANGFAYTGLNEITCYAETPPSISANTFGGINLATCVLKVYSASMEAYSQAEYWSDFSNILPLDEAVECEIVLLTSAPDGTAGGEAAGGGTYMSGEECVIAAIPNQGYFFIGWMNEDGMGFSYENPHTFTVERSMTLTATFGLESYTVTYNTPQNGTLLVMRENSPEPVLNGEWIAYNQILTITAIPDADYAIETLKVNGVDFESGSTHTVTGDVNIECSFVYAPVPVEVTFNTPANGTLTVTVNGETVASGEMVDKNSVLTITATPDAHYLIETLKVNGVDFESGDTYTVTANVEIECVFKEDGSGIDKNGFDGITVYSRDCAVYIVNNSNIRLKSVQVIDMFGRVVYTGKGRTFSTRTEAIHIPGASGYYMVQFVSEDGRMNVTKVYLTK